MPNIQIQLTDYDGKSLNDLEPLNTTLKNFEAFFPIEKIYLLLLNKSGAKLVDRKSSKVSERLQDPKLPNSTHSYWGQLEIRPYCAYIQYRINVQDRDISYVICKYFYDPCYISVVRANTNVSLAQEYYKLDARRRPPDYPSIDFADLETAVRELSFKKFQRDLGNLAYLYLAKVLVKTPEEDLKAFRDHIISTIQADIASSAQCSFIMMLKIFHQCADKNPKALDTFVDYLSRFPTKILWEKLQLAEVSLSFIRTCVDLLEKKSQIHTATALLRYAYTNDRFKAEANSLKLELADLYQKQQRYTEAAVMYIEVASIIDTKMPYKETKKTLVGHAMDSLTTRFPLFTEVLSFYQQCKSQPVASGYSSGLTTSTAEYLNQIRSFVTKSMADTALKTELDYESLAAEILCTLAQLNVAPFTKLQ